MKKLLAFALTSVLFYNTSAQTLDWVKKINSESLYIRSSETNSTGDLIIVGYFSGTIDFDPSSATMNLTASGTSDDLFIAKYLNTGTLAWAKKIGGASSESIYDVTIDNNNNIVISGNVKGIVDVNPSTTVSNIGSAGVTTTFIAKYTNLGNFTWVKTFNSNINFYHLSCDKSGRVIATGKHKGTADFNPSPSTNNSLTASTNSDDIFIASYNSSGTYSWAKTFGNNNSVEEFVNDIFVDANNDIYVTGEFNGPVDFDPSSSSYYLTSTGGTPDVFFNKFKADGTFQFAKAITGVGKVHSKGIVVDKTGNIILAGTFDYEADFDPTTSVKKLSSNTASTYDVFIAQYSFTGTYKWAKRIGNTHSEQISGLQLTKNDNILLYGRFKGLVDFNPNSPVFNLTSPGSSTGSLAAPELFVLSIKNNGYFNFAYNLGNTNLETFYTISVDHFYNEFYITGTFLGTVDFNPLGVPPFLTSVPYISTFIAKYGLPANGIAPDEDNSENNLETKSFIIEDVASGIKLYPNPANDFITIEFNSIENTNNIKIYDITGKEVNNYSITNNNTTSQLNISNFESGIYIITIQTSDKIIREKFIKQ